MTKKSTSSLSQVNSEGDLNRSPKSSTVSFIRQFARAYTVIAGVGINHLIMN